MTRYLKINISVLPIVCFYLQVWVVGNNGQHISTSTPSVPVTSTTSKPITPSNLNLPTWQVSSTNGTCILLTGNFSFAISYKTVDGYTAFGKIPIPKTAKASGNCGPFVQTLGLTWSTTGGDNNNVTFLFLKKVNYATGMEPTPIEGDYSLRTIFGMITAADPAEFPNSAVSNQSYYISASDFSEFTAPLQESYICQSYKSVAADTMGSIVLEMQGVQAQAFHNGSTAQFGEGSVCSKDTYFKILPILAYSLIALIAVAVVASFVWRKFRRSGYGQV